VERFLAFEPIQSHTGQSLADCVTTMVENLGLDFSNCRGQSFDNASNMSGRYNGLQAHLKQRNPLIHYVPCAAQWDSILIYCSPCTHSALPPLTGGSEFFGTLIVI